MNVLGVGVAFNESGVRSEDARLMESHPSLQSVRGGVSARDFQGLISGDPQSFLFAVSNDMNLIGTGLGKSLGNSSSYSFTRTSN